MSHVVQFMAAKLPILAGAGILGVSVAGLCAAAVGATFTIEAELISAIAGMITAGFAVRKQPIK